MLNHYRLGKTLGFGSAGKVILATHKATGEKVRLEFRCLTKRELTLLQVAIKIVPRFYPPIEVKGVDIPPIASRQVSHDIAREKRILRETAVVNLLRHPYICEILEELLDNNHHYLVFEHAQDSVQLLDYIITHGHFSERLARKVGRQIGSALEYCHMNNIVHRGTLSLCTCSLLIFFHADLKLENILISPSGKVKITDFGLSNLYNPNDHLSTFCGSSYFPAPELLNSAPYTGPEVDVWSFGVVLYTMVCGSVPWDDENPAALQAKIRRGSLKFPASLSPRKSCFSPPTFIVQLTSRMKNARTFFLGC